MNDVNRTIFRAIEKLSKIARRGPSQVTFIIDEDQVRIRVIEWDEPEE